MIVLQQQRRFFAEEIDALCDLQTAALVDALAAVPREHFLGPGPWIVRSELDYARASRRTRRRSAPGLSQRRGGDR